MRIYSEQQIDKAIEKALDGWRDTSVEEMKERVKVELNRRKNFEEQDEPFNKMEKHYLVQAMNTYERVFAEQIREEQKKTDGNHLLGENFAKVIFHDVRLKLDY